MKDIFLVWIITIFSIVLSITMCLFEEYAVIPYILSLSLTGILILNPNNGTTRDH